MKIIFKRYLGFIIILVLNIMLLMINRKIGLRAISISGSNILEMAKILPPIFVLLGLMDVWTPRETMEKIMGEKSGLIGILIAFFLGSLAAGPLYAAFPIAIILIKKGAKFSNILIFIGAWSTTKIPMFLFETASLGWRFSVLRLMMSIFGVITIGYVIELFISKKEKEDLYNMARLMS